jgi:hypothetical protein
MEWYVRIWGFCSGDYEECRHLGCSEMSVFTRATWRSIPKDGILHGMVCMYVCMYIRRALHASSFMEVSWLTCTDLKDRSDMFLWSVVYLPIVYMLYPKRENSSQQKYFLFRIYNMQQIWVILINGCYQRKQNFVWHCVHIRLSLMLLLNCMLDFSSSVNGLTTAIDTRMFSFSLKQKVRS